MRFKSIIEGPIWPEVIAHIDGDAFFASVAQAVNPKLKGKPVVTGKDRGIATAISYEAKKYGIHRGMTYREIKKVCPHCIFVDSDYELYSLFSKRMFEIIRQFSFAVEEYSIDEGFVDLKSLRRPLHMDYAAIGKKIKETIESNLNITVSIGISITKSLAKIASNLRKPSGLTVIDGHMIEPFLKQVSTKDVWGIGEQTSSYLKKFNIITAFDFISLPEEFIIKYLSKPFHEIWLELRGKKIFELSLEKKTRYQSISKTQTFHPSTNNKDILWSRLLQHVEEAFAKARSFHYKVGKLSIFLKTQDFMYHSIEIKLLSKTSYPLLIRKQVEEGFEHIYHKGVIYRTTGCTITDLEQNTATQASLFQDNKYEEKVKKIYPFIESKKIDFGTCLFDKVTMEEGKKVKIKPSLPFISLQQFG
jgi:DNA polymerase-4/DNA polymerase V